MRKAKAKREKPRVALSPALEAAIAGFRPIFGNGPDAAVAERIRAARAKVAAGKTLDRFEERQLTDQIIDRNRDF